MLDIRLFDYFEDDREKLECAECGTQLIDVVFENNNVKICLCEECFNRAFKDIVNLKERLKRCCYCCKHYQKDKYDYKKYSGECLKHNVCKDYNNTCENFEL